MRKRLLLVDTRPEVVRRLRELLLGVAASVHVASDFQSARILLFSEPTPDLVATALRLGPHNGLHLVHLARLTEAPPTCVVFSDQMDPYLVRETRAAGAFYESTFQIPVTVRAYLDASLPEQDRRHPVVVDRRQLYRGGRRSGDSPLTPLEWPESGAPQGARQLKGGVGPRD